MTYAVYIGILAVYLQHRNIHSWLQQPKLEQEEAV